MNTTAFHNLLENPNTLSEVDLQDLKTIVDEFPFAQSVRALYLKKLKQNDSFKYNHNLKVTAAYTADRSVLFDFITSHEFNQNSVSESIKKNTQRLNAIPVDFENISEQTKSEQQDFESHLDANKAVLDPKLFEEKRDILLEKLEIYDSFPPQEPILQSNEQKEEVESHASPENTLKIGQPLDFTKDETHSFSEWLNLIKFKPIERHQEKDANEDAINQKQQDDFAKKEMIIKSTIAKKNKLIEAFFSKSHKLEPKRDENNKFNIAKAQMIPQEELMTETLARIYLEQKNYKKAIQSYKILSLKYPEKNGFFADQIKAVKQLQEKNNIS
jgi:hypothetical protein